MRAYAHELVEQPEVTEDGLKFITALQYRDFGMDLWEYTVPFGFMYKGVTHWIPEHFITNFYSVPRLLRWVFPNNQGIYNESAGIHDWAVRNRKLIGFSLTDCHTLFDACMRYQSMPDTRRRAKFAAVYLFNWVCAGKGDGTVPSDVRKAIDKASARTGLKYSSVPK